MLGIETKCLSADRTGILVGKCIHVYKGFYKKANAVVGDRILISVRKTVAAKSVKKKISQAVVIRAKC